jgi:hypothetical protein
LQALYFECGHRDHILDRGVPVNVYNNRRGALFKRVGNIVTSIAAKTAARKEDVTPPDLTGVQAQMRTARHMPF